jgi:hypothetical protein
VASQRRLTLGIGTNQLYANVSFSSPVLRGYSENVVMQNRRVHSLRKVEVGLNFHSGNFSNALR